LTEDEVIAKLKEREAKKKEAYNQTLEELKSLTLSEDTQTSNLIEERDI